MCTLAKPKQYLIWISQNVLHHFLNASIGVSWLTILFLQYQFLSPECSVSAIADLVFLVDGSWSVGRENFKHIRSFIGALAGAFDIGEDKTRVAVVQYSTDTRTEFPLTRYTRRGDLLQAISSLPYKGGNTMTGKVLNMVDTNVNISRFVLLCEWGNIVLIWWYMV